MHFGSVFSALEPKKCWKPCVSCSWERGSAVPSSAWQPAALCSHARFLPLSTQKCLTGERSMSLYPWNSLSLRTSSLLLCSRG